MKTLAAAVALATIAVASHAQALDRCRGATRRSDGAIRVSAADVVGTLLWGAEPGNETNAFFNDPPCVSGGRARNCELGAPGTLERITPPASCAVFLKDDVDQCSAFIRGGCTPGVRPPDLPTCAGGEVLTWDGMAFRCVTDQAGPTDISVRVTNSTFLTAPHLTGTVLTFDTERWDTDDIHDLSTNTERLTAKTAGKYLVFCHVGFDTNSSGDRQVVISVNSSHEIATDNRTAISLSGTGGSGISVSTHWDLGVGDYVTCSVLQDSGTSLKVGTSLPVDFSTLEFGMVKLP